MWVVPSGSSPDRKLSQGKVFLFVYLTSHLPREFNYSMAANAPIAAASSFTDIRSHLGQPSNTDWRAAPGQESSGPLEAGWDC